MSTGLILWKIIHLDEIGCIMKKLIQEKCDDGKPYMLKKTSVLKYTRIQTNPQFLSEWNST